MVTCECGCGAQTETAAFVPGHDQRLRTRLEAQVGGILALRSLIEAAEDNEGTVRLDGGAHLAVVGFGARRARH